MLVFGIFSKLNSVESTLNNLYEAEFKDQDISLVVNNEKDLDILSDKTGELSGVVSKAVMSKLIKNGISQSDCKIIEDKVKNGSALVIVIANNKTKDVIAEILSDNGGEMIKIV